jgi:hypothetical protein
MRDYGIMLEMEIKYRIRNTNGTKQVSISIVNRNKIVSWKKME